MPPPPWRTERCRNRAQWIERLPKQATQIPWDIERPSPPLFPQLRRPAACIEARNVCLHNGELVLRDPRDPPPLEPMHKLLSSLNVSGSLSRTAQTRSTFRMRGPTRPTGTASATATTRASFRPSESPTVRHRHSRRPWLPAIANRTEALAARRVRTHALRFALVAEQTAPRRSRLSHSAWASAVSLSTAIRSSTRCSTRLRMTTASRPSATSSALK